MSVRLAPADLLRQGGDRLNAGDLPPALPGRGGSLVAFFGVTFVVTEFCFVTAAVLSRRHPAGAPLGLGLQALVLLGTFTPGIVALALTARFEGRAGLDARLARLFQWQVKSRWYVFALGYIAAIKLTAALILRLTSGAWPRFGDTPWPLLLLATLFSTAIGGQAGEELGWRGYALPRLARRMGFGGASVLLGVIWALWHLPLFFLKGADTDGQSFPLYLMQVVALSVTIGWLYLRTRGSLLLVMLLHAAVNNTKDIVPSADPGATHVFGWSHSPVAWVSLGLLGAGAVVFLATMRPGSEPGATPA